MRRHTLGANEVVLLKTDVVREGSALDTSGELVLTNFNVIFIPETLFGFGKPPQTYPLSHLKVHNGMAQAVVRGKRRRSPATLELYFLDGYEEFRFQIKEDADGFAGKIQEVRTGNAPALRLQQATTPSPQISATEILKGAVGALAGSLIGRQPEDTSRVEVQHTQPVVHSDPTQLGAREPRARVSRPCLYCRAPLSGRAGEKVTCEYCASPQNL